MPSAKCELCTSVFRRTLPVSTSTSRALERPFKPENLHAQGGHVKQNTRCLPSAATQAEEAAQVQHLRPPAALHTCALPEHVVALLLSIVAHAIECQT